MGPGYWRLWTSSGLSNLADGTFKVSLPLIAIRFTHSPTLIAGLAFALTLPWLLFALHAGALADRFDRRRAMLGANMVRTALVAVLVLVMVLQLASIWMLYAIALCIGTTETIYDTSAQSILPQLVSRDQLSRANGKLYSAELTANQFIGPPLGGLLVAVGATAAFVTPVALWVAAVGALLLVRGPFRIARTGPTTLRADIIEGLHFLWHQRVLRTLAVVTGIFNLATNATFAVFVLYAVGPTSAMRLSATAYGVLLMALAGGSLLGSFVAERVEKLLGRSRSLALNYVASALLVGTPALTTNPYLIGAAFVLGSITIVISNVIVVSLRQRVTPDRLLGRVNSGYRLVAWGTMPLGAAIGGGLAEVLGLRAVFAVMALLMLGLLGFLPSLSNSAMSAAESQGPQ
ncbi:MAG: MFS transporter [Actinomycetota bacterium]|nr:MFS transporter [Actinomycetota bacterium]